MRTHVVSSHWHKNAKTQAENDTRPHFYQTRSAWSVDQGSNKNHSPAYNFAPTVTKFCVMWEGLSLPHDTKFGNCRCRIVDNRAFPSWSLIHGLRWSGLIKAEPEWIQEHTWHSLPTCDSVLHEQLPTWKKYGKSMNFDHKTDIFSLPLKTVGRGSSVK